MDMDLSEFEMDSLIKDQVMDFTLLVFDPDRLSADDHLFRLKCKTELVITDDPMADAILDEGCKGIFFQELDDYGSVFREE